MKIEVHIYENCIINEIMEMAIRMGHDLNPIIRTPSLL